MLFAVLLADPFSLLAFLAAVLGGVFWLSTCEPLEPFFEALPPDAWQGLVPCQEAGSAARPTSWPSSSTWARPPAR